MNETILLGKGSEISEIPQSFLNKHLEQAPEHGRRRLAFMSEDHHRVRYFVVRELPRFGQPITVQEIADELSLTIEKVEAILAELEAHLFFLVRNQHGEVHWAFPVTVDSTGHKINFSSGEKLYGA